MTIFLPLARNPVMAEIALCVTRLTLALSSTVVLYTWIKKIPWVESYKIKWNNFSLLLTCIRQRGYVL